MILVSCKTRDFDNVPMRTLRAAAPARLQISRRTCIREVEHKAGQLQARYFRGDCPQNPLQENKVAAKLGPMISSTWIQHSWKLSELPIEVPKLDSRYHIESATLEDLNLLMAVMT